MYIYKPYTRFSSCVMQGGKCTRPLRLPVRTPYPENPSEGTAGCWLAMPLKNTNATIAIQCAPAMGGLPFKVYRCVNIFIDSNLDGKMKEIVKLSEL